MENMSLRTYILIFTIGLISAVCPWLGGGLTEDYNYEIILILTAIGIFLFIKTIKTEKKQIIIERKSFLLFFSLIFISAIILSSIFSIRPYNSWSNAVMWLAAMAIFFIFSQFNHERVGKIICWLSILIASVISFSSFILFLKSELEKDLRLDSFLYNPNLFAGYLIGLWPIAMSVIFSANKKIIKILLFIFNIIIGTGFLLTVSYTGWASFLPVLLFWGFYFRKPIFSKKGILTVSLAVALIFSCTVYLRYLKTSSIDQGFAIQKTISDKHGASSMNQRIYFLKAGKDIFFTRPFTGIGLGNMQLAYQKIQNNILEIPRSLHNNYLDIAVETGIFGIIGWVGFLVVLFFKNIRYLQKQRNYYFIGIFLGWVGLLLHGAIDFAWQIKIVIVNFFIFSGVMYGMYLKSVEAQDAASLCRTKKNNIFMIILILLSILFLGRGAQIFLSNRSLKQAGHFQQIGDISSAVEFYGSAWGYNKNPLFLAHIGIIQYAKKDFAQAEGTAQKWIKNSKHDPAAYQLLGRIYKQQNKLPEARIQFEKANQLVPIVNTEIKLDLIEIHYLLKEYDLLISDAESYLNLYNTLERSSFDPNLSLNLAKISDYQGNAYHAIYNMEKACISWRNAMKEKDGYNIDQQKIIDNCD